MRRRAFMLVELIAMLAVTAVVAGALTILLANLLRDVPRSLQAVQSHNQMLTLLEQMRCDIAAARSLPPAVGPYLAGPDLLLLQLPEGAVAYAQAEDQVIRKFLPADEKATPSPEQTWAVPYMKIDWRVWQKSGTPFAVEILTLLERPGRGPQDASAANAHVFFLEYPGPPEQVIK